jgi:hypothetical protein
MTLYQESASARKLVTSERAFAAPFLAITAGLVVVLLAVAVTSFVAIGRPADAATQAKPYTESIDGWMSAAMAAARQHRIEASQSLEDGWEAVLVRPHEAAVDGNIRRILLPSDEAAADGHTLRFPMQPAGAAEDGDIRRSPNAE